MVWTGSFELAYTIVAGWRVYHNSKMFVNPKEFRRIIIMDIYEVSTD